jgi:hypothetical protein
MKRSTRIIAAIAATAALGIAGIVSAQPGFGMGPAYGMGMGAGPCVGMGMGMGMSPGRGMGPGSWGGGSGFDATAAVAGHLAALRTQLKITPGQEGAWKAYEKVMTEQASAMQAERDQFLAQWHNTQPGATPPDMAAHYQAMSSLRESAWKAQNAARQELFAALTPEQRAMIADRAFGPMGARRFGPR